MPADLLVLSHKLILPCLALNMVLVIALGFANRRHFLEILRGMGRQGRLALAGILVLALIIRLFLPQHVHINFFDEHEFMAVAKNILLHFEIGDYDKEIGWPFVCSLLFGVFGISGRVAIYSTSVIGALTMAPFFVIVYLISGRDIGKSALAALFLCLMPAHIRLSASAHSNISSLFFVLTSLCVFLVYYEKQTRALLWLCVLLLGLTVQFRPENFIFVPLFFAGDWFLGKSASLKPRLGALAPWAVMLVLALPSLSGMFSWFMTTDFARPDTGINQAHSNWSLFNLLKFSALYGPAVFGVSTVPVLVSAAAVFGIKPLRATNARAFSFIALWFALMWLAVFGSWVMQNQNSGRERFYMTFYPVLCLLSSFGVFWLRDAYVRNRPGIQTVKQFTRMAAALFVISMIPYLVLARFWRTDVFNRLETRIPDQLASAAPKGCVIVANNPLIITATTDLPAMDSDAFLSSPATFHQALAQGQCFLFLHDITCVRLKDSRCGAIENAYASTKEFVLRETKPYPFKRPMEYNVQYSLLRLRNK